MVGGGVVRGDTRRRLFYGALLASGLCVVVWMASTKPPGAAGGGAGGPAGGGAGGLRPGTGNAFPQSVDGSGINAPYGGRLVDLMVPAADRAVVLEEAALLPSWQLNDRQLYDLELLLNGGFSPLTGFMTREVYDSVVVNMRLPGPSGLIWPMPIVLDVDAKTAAGWPLGQRVALRDSFFNLLAVITVADKYTPDRAFEAQQVLGSKDKTHPSVKYLLEKAGEVYVGGTVQGLQLPLHYDFPQLRLTPAQVRAKLAAMGWTTYAAFQTRNPMHRAHIELAKQASLAVGRVLIHPTVGLTKPGDVDYATRVRCYLAVLENKQRYFGENAVALSLLPLAMRIAGPREAVWHAIIRKNYGASHFVVGRDHAGTKCAGGQDCYGPYDAQNLVSKLSPELGIKILQFQEMLYVPSLSKYVPMDQVPAGVETASISGTKFRAMMNKGDKIPDWFSDPAVIGILLRVYPPLLERGFTIFFTGYSGSGKTTISQALQARLLSLDPARRITMLDGDQVRTYLSKGLGFSTQDRNANVVRIGYVAAEVTRNGGIAMSSAIAPFESARTQVRDLVTSTGGGFVLVHVSTPLEACEDRDVKGLYKQSRTQGLALTGISAPYEMPSQAELTVDASRVPVADSVDYIIGYLVQLGYLPENAETEGSLAKFEKDSSVILTASVKDPTYRLCQTRQPSLTVAIAPVPSVMKNLQSQMRAVEFLGVPSNMTLSAGFALKPEAISDISFKMYQQMRSTGGTVFASMHMLPAAATLMRLDPCLHIVVAVVADDRAAATLLQQQFPYRTLNELQGFVGSFTTLARQLSAQFPDRVVVQEAML